MAGSFFFTKDLEYANELRRVDLKLLIHEFGPEMVLRCIDMSEYHRYIDTQAHLTPKDNPSNLQGKIATDTDVLELASKLETTDHLAVEDGERSLGEPRPLEINLNNRFAF